MLMPQMDARHIRLVDATIPDCVIRISSDDLYQIIFNLVENGIKYNNDGGMLRLSLEMDENHVTMRIEDEGVLELANDGSVSVKELWLDGERIAPGTYGASLASTPAELKAHLDGAGLLRVCGGGFAIIVR